MKEIPKILLVGAGRFGLNHIRVLKSLEHNKLISFVGVVVRNKDKREKIAKDYGIKVYSNIKQDLLESVDAVDIVTPPETHYNIVKKCLPYCDVFVEKPVTIKKKDVDTLASLANKSNRVFVVGHIYRYHDVVKKLKSLVDDKGIPKKIIGSFINPAKSDQGREISIELLHLFDIIDFLWNKDPKVVFSTKNNRLNMVDMRLSNENEIHLTLGWKGEDKIRNLKLEYLNEFFQVDLIENSIIQKKTTGELINEYHFKEIEEPLHCELIDFVKKIGKNKKYTNIDLAKRVLFTAIDAIPKRNIKKPKIAIIGGGIFGTSVAMELGSFCDVTLFEKNDELLQEGTLINQFRHHYGYHYPRSDETVIDVQKSRADFENIFKKALFIDSPTYYAISKKDSKVNVEEFIKFCKKHKLPYKKEYPPKNFLSRDEIDLSIRVPEPSYRHKVLKSIVKNKIKTLPNINVCLGAIVSGCNIDKNGKKNISYSIKNISKSDKFDFVINATYANINRFVNWLNFDKCPIRVDLAEVIIIKLPVKPVSVTVIDGEFATLMPTGNKNEFTLYHVKESIIDRYVPVDGLIKKVTDYRSKREAIFNESLKFFPILKSAEFVENRIVHRGVQAYHEHDDSRVADLINHGFGCWSILSGKILSSVTTAKRLKEMIKKSISS